MSLYRQMWLTVLFCMALAFGASLAVSLSGVRATIAAQLAAKDTDGAAALALSMSQMPKDRATLELQAASLFEQGQYEAIRVHDREGRLLVDFSVPARPADTLVGRLLPITAAPGRAEISDGPVRFGTVELASVRDAAHAQLNTIAQRLLAGFVLAAALTGLLSSLVLRRLRAPLSAVIDQAQAVQQRRFKVVAEPRVPELASVVRAMNEMVGRVRAMFDEEANRLEQMRHAAHHDALTGLPNREHFMGRLDALLDAEASGGNGALILLRLRDLAGFNRHAGRAAADSLLQRVAAVLIAQGESIPGAVIGRLNGADMALALPGEAGDGLRAYQLLEALASVLAADDVTVAIGTAGWRDGETAAELLARADMALAHAEQQPGSRVAIALDTSDSLPRSANAWRAMLWRVLQERRLQLAAYPVLRLGGAKKALLHRECFLRIDPEGSGNWLPAGRFMPQVLRLEMNAEVDMAVAHQVLEEIRTDGESRALNLAADSLRSPGFVDALLAAIDTARIEPGRLWVELPCEAFAHFDALAALVRGLHARGSKVGLERFGRDFSRIARLHELGFDYVKIDAGFIKGIAQAEGNRRFLANVCSVLKGLGCTVIADGVQDPADLEALLALEFDAAGGPAVREA